MSPRDDRSTARLITGLFVRRLIHNDLMSPHADRHESLAVVYAFFVSVATFITFFISTDYLAAFIQLPGPTALSALSDRFLFVAGSITITALGALMVWDSLALEPRDAAVLGPLPIPASTLTRAKLAAASIFGVLSAVAVNAVPTVLYPLFLTLNMRGISGRGIIRLIAVHGLTVVMAGLLGFFGVLAARGVLQLMAGERRFRTLSSTVHSIGIVCAVTAVLLAPTVRAADVQGWIAGRSAAPWPARPVLWFLGVNESLAGHIVAETPVVLPPRFSFLGYARRQDQAARTAYRALAPRFRALEPRAWSSVLLAIVLGIVTFLWNNRRLPDRSAPRHPARRTSSAIRAIVQWLAPDDAEAEAGLRFTAQTLSRSTAHRTIVAISIAAALTHALMTVTVTRVTALPIDELPLGLYAVTYATLLALILGFRYAVTVPAELSANWTIRMAWRGDERRFLAGSKRAALCGVIMVIVLGLLPFNVLAFGAAWGVAHSACGVLFAVAALDVVFLGYRKVPFACTYVPLENPKLAWPAGFAIVAVVTYGCAALERTAWSSAGGAAGFVALLAVAVLFARLADGACRRERRTVEFDAKPAPPTQRLDLFEHLAIND